MSPLFQHGFYFKQTFIIYGSYIFPDFLHITISNIWLKKLSVSSCNSSIFYFAYFQIDVRSVTQIYIKIFLTDIFVILFIGSNPSLRNCFNLSYLNLYFDNINQYGTYLIHPLYFSSKILFKPLSY